VIVCFCFEKKRRKTELKGYLLVFIPILLNKELRKREERIFLKRWFLQV
jgi:hypothetical protein